MLISLAKISYLFGDETAVVPPIWLTKEMSLSNEAIISLGETTPADGCMCRLMGVRIRVGGVLRPKCSTQFVHTNVNHVDLDSYVFQKHYCFSLISVVDYTSYKSSTLL